MPVLRTITEANVLLAGGVNELVVSEVTNVKKEPHYVDAGVLSEMGSHCSL